jgi:hypothetical protein
VIDDTPASRRRWIGLTCAASPTCRSHGRRAGGRRDWYRWPVPEPGTPRELRNLVPFEVAAVLALAIAPLPEAMPVALPLLVVASLSRWLRGRT